MSEPFHYEVVCLPCSHVASLGRGSVDLADLGFCPQCHEPLAVRRHLPGAPLIPEFVVEGEVQHLPTVIRDVFGISCSEGRRMIAQGGVSLNGRVTDKQDVRLAEGGSELRVGKRRFVTLRKAAA